MSETFSSVFVFNGGTNPYVSVRIKNSGTGPCDSVPLRNGGTFVKINGPRSSVKPRILIWGNDVFFRFARLLGAKNAIFGLPTQF